MRSLRGANSSTSTARNVANDSPSMPVMVVMPHLSSNRGAMVSSTAAQVGRWPRRIAHNAALATASSPSGWYGRVQNTASHTARHSAPIRWR